MPASPSQILAHHQETLKGRLQARVLDSEALGLRKTYYLYEPPTDLPRRRLPLLYLFRGHEREWVNVREDASRRRSTAIDDVDARIQRGTVPPMMVVMPGLNSDDNHIPSLGIDMAGKWPATKTGLGSGRYWHYLTHELMPAVEADLPETRGGRRLAAGFSLGGYTVALLAAFRPGYFDHVGIYDGLFMWPDHHDPREPEPGSWTDPVWCRAGIFDAAFGKPRNAVAMRRWNPTDALRHASASQIEALRRTTFWIRCAAADGSRGNRDRARFFAELLREKGVPLGYAPDAVVLDDRAAHTWHWTDTFLMRFLEDTLSASHRP